MKRLCSALLCLALGCASLAGCSTQEPAPAPSPSASPEVSQVEETYEIGLVQYKEHTALNSLREAFMGRLEEWGCDESQVKIDYQNAGGDLAQAAEICSGFVQQEVDMIVAIATPGGPGGHHRGGGHRRDGALYRRGRGVRLGPGGRPEGHRRGLPPPR